MGVKYCVVYVDEVVAITDNGILVEIEGEQHWIPKSQVDWKAPDSIEPKKGSSGDMTIPEWLAEEKEIEF